MGYRGSQTGELVFEDCRVPVENLVGEENNGVAIVMSGLDLERAMISPLCLGVAERALELSIDYAKTRRQFGKPIGAFQMVQSMLADMYVAVETMRTFTYRTLAAAAPLEVGGGGRGEIHKLTAASVMYAADACHKVLDLALQIHGGTGYIWESEINRLFRSTKLLEIGAGTTEVRKLIIAGELLEGHAARWLTPLPKQVGEAPRPRRCRLGRPCHRLCAGIVFRTGRARVGRGGRHRPGDFLAACAARRACHRCRAQARQDRRPRRGAP